MIEAILQIREGCPETLILLIFQDTIYQSEAFLKLICKIIIFCIFRSVQHLEANSTKLNWYSESRLM